MRKMKSIYGPTLAAGVFTMAFGEFGVIKTDYPEQPVTGAATAGTPTINMTNTDGFVIGQVITIQDTLNHEVRTITAVTPGVSLTVGVNLTNTYTAARGGRVTATTAGAPRVMVKMSNPFSAGLDFDVSWTVSGTTVSVLVEKMDINAGALRWQQAASADIAGSLFTVDVDGE
jgi:hypothetical protein